MARSTMKCVALAMAIWTSASYAEQHEAEAKTFTLSERLHYEALIDAELNHWLNIKPRFPEQRGPFLVKSRIDTASGYLMVELGREFGPLAADLEMEDLSKEIDEYVDGIVPAQSLKGVKLLFGGGDISHWFPELGVDMSRKPGLSRRRRSAGGSNRPARVLVSAGHGAYFHHGFMKWTTQRDEHNGVIEDHLTQDFSERLGLAFQLAEPRIIPVYSRSLSDALHEESGFPWRSMAARYWIKHNLPLEEGLWHSMKESKSPARERLEDLYSRVLFANHSDVDAAIHIHSNASSNSAVRGMRAYFQEGSREGQKLADSILCHVKERMKFEEDYKDYPIRSLAVGKNYAELRGARMPSALIEMGFHTNVDDANAMKERNFQRAAMTGVRKGFEEFSAGRGCEPFELTSAKNLGLHEGTDLVNLEVNFSGHPRFPIELTTYHDENITGPDKCHSYPLSETRKSARDTSVLDMHALCPPTITQSKVEVWAKDADGLIATTSVDLICPGREWDLSDDCNLEPGECDCSK